LIKQKRKNIGDFMGKLPEIPAFFLYQQLAKNTLIFPF